MTYQIVRACQNTCFKVMWTSSFAIITIVLIRSVVLVEEVLKQMAIIDFKKLIIRMFVSISINSNNMNISTV